MKTYELIHLLQAQNNKEVLVKIENGLYYPVKAVKTSAENVIIICKDITIFDESSGFKPVKFETSVKTNKK